MSIIIIIKLSTSTLKLCVFRVDLYTHGLIHKCLHNTQFSVTTSVVKDELFFYGNVVGNRASEGKAQVEGDVFITVGY